MSKKILFVITGARHWTLADGTEHPTGFWAEELVTPYRAFTQAGYDVDFATPGGVAAVADQASLSADANGGQKQADAIASELEGLTGLKTPLTLEDVGLGDYAAVFYPGGHGPMEDLAVNAGSARVLVEALQSHRPLGIVCHGPAALLATESDGVSPFSGYRLTAFTNAEEAQAGLADKAKWLLQDRLVKLGAEFEAGEPWQAHTVVDRNLYTGQNPASSGLLSNQIIEALAK